MVSKNKKVIMMMTMMKKLWETEECLQIKDENHKIYIFGNSFGAFFDALTGQGLDKEGKKSKQSKKEA